MLHAYNLYYEIIAFKDNKYKRFMQQYSLSSAI